MNESKPYLLAVRAAIWNDEHHCLLIRRSAANRSFVGAWEWPGGKADPGETIDEALCREVMEETGLTIALERVVGVYPIDMDRQCLAVLCFDARVTGGDLRLSDEHDDFVWVPKGQMTDWSLTPGFREFVEAYERRKMEE